LNQLSNIPEQLDEWIKNDQTDRNKPLNNNRSDRDDPPKEVATNKMPQQTDYTSDKWDSFPKNSTRITYHNE